MEEVGSFAGEGVGVVVEFHRPAAVAVGRQWDRLSDKVRVSLPGGDLLIRWKGEGKHLFMTGPAANVFEGSIEL